MLTLDNTQHDNPTNADQPDTTNQTDPMTSEPPPQPTPISSEGEQNLPPTSLPHEEEPLEDTKSNTPSTDPNAPRIRSQYQATTADNETPQSSRTQATIDDPTEVLDISLLLGEQRVRIRAIQEEFAQGIRVTEEDAVLILIERMEEERRERDEMEMWEQVGRIERMQGEEESEDWNEGREGEEGSGLGLRDGGAVLGCYESSLEGAAEQAPVLGTVQAARDSGRDDSGVVENLDRLEIARSGFPTEDTRS